MKIAFPSRPLDRTVICWHNFLPIANKSSLSWKNHVYAFCFPSHFIFFFYFFSFYFLSILVFRLLPFSPPSWKFIKRLDVFDFSSINTLQKLRGRLLEFSYFYLFHCDALCALQVNCDFSISMRNRMWLLMTDMTKNNSLFSAYYFASNALN